jgi:DNA-binding XRE family transcriptional regulator
MKRNRKLSAEEAEKYARIRRQIESEKPEILERAKAYRAVTELVQTLKAARDAAGLSLADVRDRTGIDRGALSRLETGVRENPSIETLVRYAEAVGCRLIVAPAQK